MVSKDHISMNIGIKHVFPCINIRWVPREVLKTEDAALGFQQRPRNPANVNARKKTCLIAIISKKYQKVDFRVVFQCILLALFCFDFLHQRTKMISIDRSRAICKQLLNHGGKLARIHHMVAEFTNCSGCLPFILIVDNCICFTIRRQVRLCSSPFCPVSISIFIPDADTGNTNAPEMDN